MPNRKVVPGRAQVGAPPTRVGGAPSPFRLAEKCVLSVNSSAGHSPRGGHVGAALLADARAEAE